MQGKVAGNVIWNWSGMGINMLAGFIVTPYLVARLGDGGYGLWIVIASMTGYFSLLDLGVRSSVGRYVAYHRARGEQDGVNAMLSTSIAILLGVGLLVVAATVAALPLFPHLFTIPPQQLTSAKWAIVIVGLNLAITFPLSVFDGTLWGFERFDLMNAIEIPTAIIRAGLTFMLIHEPNDISTLAWLTFATTAANETIKMIVCFRVNPGLSVERRFVQKAAAVKLYGYGIWQFLLSISRQINGAIGPQVIGALLGLAAVTPFSIASRLISYASSFMVAATGVFTPVATAICARQDDARQRQLFLIGGQWCAVMATYFAMLMLLLGAPFLKLWMGDHLAARTPLLLTILTLGEWLPMSQWLTGSIILAMAKHKLSAIANLLEGVLAVAGMLMVMERFELVGVCIAFAVAALLCRGIFQLVYGCSLVRIPVRHYVFVAILKPLGAALLPTAILTAALWAHSPSTWVELFVYGLGFSAVFGATSLWMLGLWKYLPLDRFRLPRTRIPEPSRVPEQVDIR